MDEVLKRSKIGQLIFFLFHVKNIAFLVHIQGL